MKIVSKSSLNKQAKSRMGFKQHFDMPKDNEHKIKTDDWYDDQPEWGTPKSTSKAKKKTPGQNEEVELENYSGLAGMAMGAYMGHKIRKNYEDRPKYNGKNTKKRTGKTYTNYATGTTPEQRRINKKKMKDYFDRKKTNEEVAAGANTGSIPNPIETSQGKKRKYSVLTRHYIEIAGKRKKVIK